jgi:hypothetical protein
MEPNQHAIYLFILAKGAEISWFGPALYETGDLNEFLLEGSGSGEGASSGAARDRSRSVPCLFPMPTATEFYRLPTILKHTPTPCIPY